MTEDATTTTMERHELVPAVVLEATRELFGVKGEADARRIAEHLVQGLGGTLVAAGESDANAIPNQPNQPNGSMSGRA